MHPGNPGNVLEFTIFRDLSWKCPGIFLLQFTIFLVIISVRVPSTLKNLENSLLSLILFNNLTLDFFVPLGPYLQYVDILSFGNL